jgi:hypothetical protein
VDFKQNRQDKHQKSMLESDLVALLKKHKSKSEYDCLVMCSGGKDSTAALYFMKKRYGLNPLAFTFDNGFEVDEAIENIKNATDILGVDLLFFKTSKMLKMFEDVVKMDSPVVICHLCSIWYMELTFKMAARFNIPIIVAGWTRGQSKRQPDIMNHRYDDKEIEFSRMGAATKKFLKEYTKNNPQYSNFPKSIEEVIRKAKKRHKTIEISPHWFLPYDSKEYTEIIIKKLNWKYPKLSYPCKSTNCGLNFISVYNSMKHYGYTHYHIEMSKMIRAGLITREEALKDLEITFDNELLNSFAKKINYKF